MRSFTNTALEILEALMLTFFAFFFLALPACGGSDDVADDDDNDSGGGADDDDDGASLTDVTDAFGENQKKADLHNPGEPCFIKGQESCSTDRTMPIECQEQLVWAGDEGAGCDPEQICIMQVNDPHELDVQCIYKGDICPTHGGPCEFKDYLPCPATDTTSCKNRGGILGDQPPGDWYNACIYISPEELDSRKDANYQSLVENGGVLCWFKVTGTANLTCTYQKDYDIWVRGDDDDDDVASCEMDSDCGQNGYCVDGYCSTKSNSEVTDTKLGIWAPDFTPVDPEMPLLASCQIALGDALVVDESCDHCPPGSECRDENGYFTGYCAYKSCKRSEDCGAGTYCNCDSSLEGGCPGDETFSHFCYPFPEHCVTRVDCMIGDVCAEDATCKNQKDVCNSCPIGSVCDFSDRIDIDGLCHPTACNRNEDCDEGAFCDCSLDEGECQGDWHNPDSLCLPLPSSCDEDSDCPSGYVCPDSSVCYLLPLSCSYDSECPPLYICDFDLGWVCVGGVAPNSAGLGDYCASTNDCIDGLLCSSDYQQCVECFGNAHCDKGMHCTDDGKCHACEFVCLDGTCLSQESVCDGYPDCAGGNDELQCGDDDAVPEDDDISPSDDDTTTATCRSDTDCPEGAFCTINDECACEFTCSDGKCIRQAWVCDGVTDCTGGEDESQCGGCSSDSDCADGEVCDTATGECGAAVDPALQAKCDEVCGALEAVCLPELGEDGWAVLEPTCYNTCLGAGAVVPEHDASIKCFNTAATCNDAVACGD